MSQLNPEHQSQLQDNLLKDTTVSGDLIFAPEQIGTKIETQILQISVAKVTQQPLIINSPYQGLKRFNVKDRDHFFGRDHLIARLFEAVNQTTLSLILGASGSGKSSLVRAGLIPELKKSLKSQKFYDFIFTPNKDPFDSLYRCLLNEEKDYTFSKIEAEIALEATLDTIPNIIKNLKKDGERWLIFVDQFEELFTNCTDLEKRNNFISGLLQVVRSNDSSIKLLLAMRSDFLEQFSFYPELGAIANQQNIHLITEMYPDELRQAIEQPAAKHGVVFEEGLVEEIIKDVQGQKGYLPLLQYTLDLLWEGECRTLGLDGRPNIEERILNKASYTALEGVRGALQKRVNDIYSNLNQDEQAATKQVFVKLVNIVDTDSGSKTISRRAYRNEFVGNSVSITLNRFIEERLLVGNSDYTDNELSHIQDGKLHEKAETVEIAHEILLSSWRLLKDWLEQEKEAIILKNWLSSEVKRWQKVFLEDESRANEELLKGSRLDQVIEFINKDAFKNLGGLRVDETEFVNASVAWRDRQIEIEREQKLKELEAEVALSIEKERVQILDQALNDAKVTISNAQKQKKKIIGTALIVSAGIATVALIIIAIASQELIVAQKATELEQAGNSAKQQFRLGQLESLLTAMRSGQDLKSIVKDNRNLQDYPTVSPLSALQYILDNIYEQNYFNASQQEVKSVSFNADGQQIVTGGLDGTIKLWDLSGQLLNKWDAHQSVVNFVGFNSDGSQIISAGVDGTVQIRNLSDNKPIKSWIAHPEGGINFLAVDKEEKIIATAGGDGKIGLWDFSGKPLLPPWEAVAKNDGVMGIAIDAKEKKIVSSGDTDGMVKVWDFSGKLLKQFKASQNEPILNVSFSPDGKQIATAGVDGMGKLWDLSGNLLASFKGHQGQVTSITFNSDGTKIITTSWDHTVRIWNRSGQVIAELRGHSAGVESASLSRDSQQLVTGGRDNTVRLWNLEDKTIVRLQANQSDINSVSFNPKKPQIAAAGDDGMVRLWNFSGSLDRVWDAKRKPPKISSISISPGGEHLVISGYNNLVRIFSISGKKGNRLEPHHQGSVKTASFSPDGKYIVTAGADGTARLWDSSGIGKELATLTGHEGEVTSAIFSPNSQFIATSGADSTVRLWNLVGQEQRKLLGHQGRVNSVGFSPDSQKVVSAGADGTVRIWNLTGKQELEFYTYQMAVNSVSFSPDGQLIATGGTDGTVKLWDRKGRRVFELTGKGQPFWDVDFSADGQLIAAAEGQGTVYLWHPKDLDELLGQGCQWLKYYLDAHQSTLKDLKVCSNK